MNRAQKQENRMTRAKAHLTRRQVLVWTGGALASTRLFHALAAGAAADIAPQPYFASVKRALESLEKLGAPVRVEDAQHLTALARQNDAAAVTAAEAILGRYTLSNIEVNADGGATGTVGDAQRTLIEQGWRYSWCAF